MDRYIRFQTQLRCGTTGRPAGIFVAAGRVERSNGLNECRRTYLKESLDWFNLNLRAPRLDSGA